jgi:hypothetical protein
MADEPLQPTQSSSPTQYPVTETTLRQRSQELGLLGKVFGSRDHAPVNIAGAIIILGIMGLVACPFLPESPSFSRADIAKTLGGLILAAFTFLGGYLGGSAKPPAS